MTSKPTAWFVSAIMAAGLASHGASAQSAAAPAPASGINQNFFDRFFQAYADDWAGVTAPADPNAAPTRRAAPFPPQPQTVPPMPFIDWPYGGASTIGASVPNAVISPLMTALAPTALGQAMSDAHIQVYGWVNGGGNFSTNTTRKAGNFPAVYSYNPNTAQLDQFALYIERVPDTVQKDHIDWGFRVAGIYGMNYRFTTAYGLWSYQLQNKNYINGYDFPMVYGELYIPNILEGLVLRLGRYISVPDIEAQLAPNNYMYSHSMTYGFDNYTNTGLIGTLQVTKNWIAQFGVSAGTDTLHTDTKKDPGMQPSYTGCLRWSSDSSRDSIYGCANGINNGTWGYNNLQSYVLTYYHRFSERWHISTELWHMHQRNVPNADAANFDYTTTIFGNLRNGPFAARCNTGTQCTAQEYAGLFYLNYRASDHDNISFRGEFFNDLNGQRTGVTTKYLNAALGWQHWIGNTVTLRPEIAVYNSLDKRSFDIGTQRSSFIASADIIWHF